MLDYGCGDSHYRRLVPDGCEWVGVDLPGNPRASLELTPNGRVPAEDASFDAVLSTQVLEHAEDPGLYLAECARVLRPGGRMLLSTHGISVFHPDPEDIWRWTGPGLQRIVADAGFETERFEGVGLTSTGSKLFQDGLLGRLPAVAPTRRSRSSCSASSPSRTGSTTTRAGATTRSCTRSLGDA